MLEREHHRIRCEAEEDAADRLVMRLSPPSLLRGGMHVAKEARSKWRNFAVRKSLCRVAPGIWEYVIEWPEAAPS